MTWYKDIPITSLMGTWQGSEYGSTWKMQKNAFFKRFFDNMGNYWHIYQFLPITLCIQSTCVRKKKNCFSTPLRKKKIVNMPRLRYLLCMQFSDSTCLQKSHRAWTSAGMVCTLLLVNSLPTLSPRILTSFPLPTVIPMTHFKASNFKPLSTNLYPT